MLVCRLRSCWRHPSWLRHRRNGIFGSYCRHSIKPLLRHVGEKQDAERNALDGALPSTSSTWPARGKQPQQRGERSFSPCTQSKWRGRPVTSGRSEIATPCARVWITRTDAPGRHRTAPHRCLHRAYARQLTESFVYLYSRLGSMHPCNGLKF